MDKAKTQHYTDNILPFTSPEKQYSKLVQEVFTTTIKETLEVLDKKIVKN